jgi:hypothetical protein
VKKALLFLFLLALAIIGVSSSASLFFGVADAGTNVVGIITSNTTWTKANSPYTLTGPVAVNTGVTLTIEPGVSVNLNNFYIQVNGTLTANGNDSDKISFNNGQIIFTSVSNGWNESTGSGCKIENAVLDETGISSNNPLKVSNCTTNKDITAGNSSVISYNDASANWIVVDVGEASVVTNNIINGYVSGWAPSLTVTNNTIFGYGGIETGTGSIISNNYVWVGNIRGGSTIINNTVNGAIYGIDSLATISNNTVYGRIEVYCGEFTITNNTIYGDLLLDITGTSLWVVASHNVISGGIVVEAVFVRGYQRGTCYNATLSDNYVSSIYSHGVVTAKIDRNIITSGGIYLGNEVNATAVNNTVAFSNVGIRVDAGATSTIVSNIIASNNVGVRVDAGVFSSILNNTIAFNNIGIRLGSSSQNISYNNFQDTSGYNIYLGPGVTSNVDVANNWWGTTDTQAINQSIWDFKNDFNLGKVNFVPFLTAPNPAAPTIPTFNILASAEIGGSIDPSGSISVPYGGNQTFAITADTGYHIADVTVDGGSVGTVSSYTFTNVQAEHTIAATFAPTPTPTPSPSPSPSPTPTPTPSPTPSLNPSPSPTATPTPTPTPTSSPTPTPTPSPTATPSPSSSPQPTATASPTPPPDTGIYLSTPLFYAIIIAFIALAAIITALIIKRKK